jgi:hypothetical protein
MQSAISNNIRMLLRLSLTIALCFFFVCTHTNGTALTLQKSSARNTTNINRWLNFHFRNSVLTTENTTVTNTNTTNTALAVFSNRCAALRNTATSPAVDGAAYTRSPSSFGRYLHHFQTSRSPENHTPFPTVLTETNANSCSIVPNGIDLTELIGQMVVGSSPVAAVRAHCSHSGLTGFSEVGLNASNNASPLSVELSLNNKYSTCNRSYNSANERINV